MRCALLLIVLFLLSLGSASAAVSVSGSVRLGETTTVQLGGETHTVSHNFFNATLLSTDLLVDGEMLYDTWVGDIWTLDKKGMQVTITGVNEAAREVYFSIAEYCAPESALGCYEGAVYWYDSCGERGDFHKACGHSEACIGGECKSTCGNGICESYENGNSCEQDCGCPPGERECKGSCAAEGGKRAGEMYDCEWECASQFGENGRCLDPITTILSASRPSLAVGESTPVAVSMDSASSSELDANIVLTLDSGASLSAVDSADSCTANLCKIFRRLPAKGMTKVSVQLTCESIGTVALSSKITYGAAAQGNTLSDSIYLKCTEDPQQKRGAIGLFTRFFRWLAGLLW